MRSASALSPADAIETHTSPGWIASPSIRTSASSHTCAYRIALKSARSAGSLRTVAHRGRNAPHDAGAAVHLHPVIVFQPTRETWQRDDRRDAELARDDRGVREQAAALDQHAAR